MARKPGEDPRHEQHVAEPGLDRAGAWEEVIGDGIPDRAHPQFVPCLLLGEELHQSVGPVTLLFVEIDPSD